MKKVFLFFAFLMISVSSYAGWDIIIENPNATRIRSFETIKKWVSTTLDLQNISIKYEDAKSGVIVINGDYKDTSSSLLSIRYGFVSAYVSYQLEIRCDDGYVFAKFNKMAYSTKSLYGNYSLSTNILEIIRDELKVIAELKIKKGQAWNINKDFIREYEELKSAIQEAEQKKDDNNISKKERKKYRKFYENNKIKGKVYDSINYMGIDLKYNVIYKKTGLMNVIENIN